MMAAEEPPRPAENQPSNSQPMDVTQGPNSASGQNDIVSAIHKCQSQQAKKIAIFDVSFKLKQTENYDIGGTYIGEEADLWFYYTTSVCPGYNYLLNLFVCHRKVGNFSVSISSSSELTVRKQRHDTNHAYLSDTLTWYSFRSAQRDDSFYIKSFCFTENDLKTLEECTLFIPVQVAMNIEHTLNKEVIKSIKLNHDFGDLLAKQETTDFYLESASRKKFQAHKIILAAHSPVLRAMVKNNTTNWEFIDITDTDMELLLQFIYTGTIKDIMKQDCLKLLEIADRFQLKNLFALTQFAISAQINVTNAVDVAILSEKYTLEQLQTTVFEFIKNNPAVLETDGWKNLSEINLSKKLFQYMFKSRSSRN